LDAGWTDAPDHGPVVTSYLLRLLDERRASGELVGEIEAIGSGETVTVRSADELVAFISRPPAENEECDE
jgi:hypothetical protein